MSTQANHIQKAIFDFSMASYKASNRPAEFVSAVENTIKEVLCYHNAMDTTVVFFNITGAPLAEIAINGFDMESAPPVSHMGVAPINEATASNVGTIQIFNANTAILEMLQFALAGNSIPEIPVERITLDDLDDLSDALDSKGDQ